MNKVLNLTWAFLWEHPLRWLLTTLAAAAATSLVVWIASSYDALQRTYDEYADLALGRYQLAIAPIDLASAHAIPQRVVEDLRADQRLQVVDPMWAQRLAVSGLSVLPRENRPIDSREKAESPPSARQQADSQDRFAEAGSLVPRAANSGADEASSAIGGGLAARRPVLPELLFVGTDAASPPHDMQMGRWLLSSMPTSARTPAEPEVVLRADTAQARELTVGSLLQVKLGNQTCDLRVVGIANGPSLAGAGPAGPQILTPSSAEAFVRMDVAQELFATPPKISLIGIALTDGTDLTKFRFGWAPQLSSYRTPVQFQEAFEIEEALDQEAAAQNVRLQAYAATGVAMLVSTLVILCSLSVGVNERVRQYAILRAISFSRTKIGGLILLEGLVLGISGLLVGLFLSWLLLRLVGYLSARLLYHGLHLGFWSLVLAGVAMIGGSLIASIIPAYRAMRVKPMDAMSPQPESIEDVRLIRPSLWIGLALLAVNPLLTFVFPPQSEGSVYAALAIGFATMAVGFVLLAPLVVRAVDRWVSPSLARLLAVDPQLVSSQLSARLWRSVGAAISLAFGLGLFLGIHVWGWTMLEAFVPGDWAPDALVAVSPGLSPEQAQGLAALDGIDEEQFMPLVAEQPRLLQDLTGSAERASITRQDNIILVGLDPGIAFGAHPLLALDWVSGDPETAIQRMNSSRACVVPDHFLRETGLTLHDTVALVPPQAPEQPVRYEIVGAVKLPGWHWQTKLTGLRPRTHRAAALALAGFDSVAQDFDIPGATHVWLNYDQSQPDPDRLGQAMTNWLASGDASGDAFGTDMEASAPAVRVVPVEGIRLHLRSIARRWLWVISQIPLLALVIAALGVLNVLLASVRARRWEFGVMRAVGIGRAELSRAILLEGILIALVACILSVSFGVLAGWCGCGLAQYISFFGGLHPPLVIPPFPIVVGVALALTLGLLCALAPAIAIGRSRPLDLLQQAQDSL